MIYIYDILLNFCDCDLIYDFYEWNQSDNVENIKRIKLIHINRETFDNLLNCDGVIDNNFLLKIYRTCEVYTTKKVKIVDYACLFSDGDRVMAIEFNNEGRPIYKSKLLIDEEEEIAILASNLEKLPLEFEAKEIVLEKRYFTRNELTIRRYLMREIDESFSKKNYGKLKYLYQEYFDKESSTYSSMKEELLDSMKLTIDDKHKNIYQLLKLTKKKQV